jgi:MFS family permease
MNKKGIGLTIALALISLQFGLGIVLGYFTAKFLSGKKTGERGVINSLILRIGDYKIHLHHWLLSSAALAFFIFFDFFYSHLFFGFIGGWVVQGIFSYKDWKKILIKRKKNDQGRRP